MLYHTELQLSEFIYHLNIVPIIKANNTFDKLELKLQVYKCA